MKGYNNGAGLSFGAVFNNTLAGKLYIEPGAMLYYDTMGDDVKDTSGKYKVSATMWEFGVRIPINLGLQFDFDKFGIKVFTGPEFNYGFMCKEKVKLSEGKVSIAETIDIYEEDVLNRFGFAWAVGASVVVKRFELSMMGSIGVSNLGRNGHDCHRNRFTVSAGWNF